MIGWREELLGLVQSWERRAGPDHRAPRTLGVAHRTGTAGWYFADLRGGPGPERLEDLRLGHPTETAGHPVLELEASGDVVHLRVSAHVDDAVLELRGSDVSASRLVKALRLSLASLMEPGLANDLVEGKPAKSTRAVPVSGLNPEQQQAYAACHSPGLHLVWGPPGTGKTRVLGTAVDDLLAAGNRVLLVSATGVAVDDALLGALRRRHPGPGVAVWVGQPQHPEIARDDHVNLARLVSHRTTKLTQQRDLVEQELVSLTAPGRELADIARQLTNVDEDAYHRAVALEEHERRRAAAVEAFAAAWYSAHQAEKRRDHAEDELHRSMQRRAELQPAANLLAEATTLERELDALRADHERVADAWGAALDMLRAHDERAADLATTSSWRRLRTRSTVRVHQQRQERLQLQVDEAHEELDRSASVTDDRAATLTVRIHWRREQAAPTDEEAVLAADRGYEQSAARSAATGDQLAKANAAAEEAGAELQAAEALPRFDEAHRRLLADARSRGIPELLARRGELRTVLAASSGQIRYLEHQQDRQATELERIRLSAETQVIRGARLVATTLAHANTHPAVLRDQYDVVLVDDVGAALMPELVAVLARAGSTAVLLGDFRQIGPTLPAKLNPHRPDVKKWLVRDAFAFCGITSPKMARQQSGCVVLRQQYRLPPLVTALANEVAYGDVLEPHRSGSTEDTQIVFVDTDGLDDLAAVRPAGRSTGWWPAGALLSSAIARHHRDNGESVGVITPHGPQTEIALDAARDVESPEVPEIAVGAGVHGREFDVAVLDLVGSGEDARLFTVAVTRPRHRLYLVGSASGVRAARKGSALGAVAAMLADGRVHRLPMAAVLDGEQCALPELADALAARIQVVDRTGLLKDIDAAEESIWLWAPCTGDQLAPLLDALAAAAARGVRVVAFVHSSRHAPPGVRVIEYPDLYQEMLVTDRRRSLIRLRDGLLAHDGPMFAERLLLLEHAEALSAVPQCPQCPSTPRIRRYKSDSPLWWVCPRCGWSHAAY